MLVLSRRLGEEVVIAGTIRVTVIDVKRGQVRLGITAPPAIPVQRKEIQERRDEQSAALRSVQPK